MERAPSRTSLAPFVSESDVASPEAAGEASRQARLLLVLSLQAATFALASASGKMPEFAVILFRALLMF
jgi:hypothetical protein